MIPKKCRFCDLETSCVTTWEDKKNEWWPRFHDFFAMYQCANGHICFTLGKFDGSFYRHEFVNPEDLRHVIRIPSPEMIRKHT